MLNLLTIVKFIICLVILVDTQANAQESNITQESRLFEVVTIDGYKEIMELNNIINNGVDINAVNDDGLSAIHLAARFNPDPKIIQILVEHGANINEPSAYAGMDIYDKKFAGKPLFFALCYNPNYDVIKTILDMQSSTERFSLYQMLTLAARNPNICVITNLYGLMLNDLLQNSAKNPNSDISEALIEQGADINGLTFDSPTTALYTAVIANNFDSVQFFLSAGANYDMKYSERKSILLVAASNGVNRKATKIIDLLLMYGCNINDVDIYGNTALHLAVKKATSLYHDKYNGYPLDVIEELLYQGADISTKNHDGETALDYAKSHRKTNTGNANLSQEVIDILINASEVSSEDEGMMPACG